MILLRKVRKIWMFLKNIGRSKNKDVIIDLVETGAEISGSIAGSVIGGLLAGPPGMIIGGATGPLLSKALKQVGNEIQQRLISPWEEIRIGAALTFALNKLNENQKSGMQIRTDIFEAKDHQRSDSTEIFEGIIINAQKEYEERKIKFLGCLFANICTNPNISKEHASQLIKTLSNSSYRQLCIMQYFQTKKANGFSSTPIKDLSKNDSNTKFIKKGDLIIEIRDLHQKGLLTILSRINLIDDNSSPIELDDINVSDSGILFCEMLSLSEISKEDVDQIREFIE